MDYDVADNDNDSDHCVDDDSHDENDDEDQ